MSNKRKTVDKKIILVGNGFTSSLVPNYRNSVMKQLLRNQHPMLVDRVDSLWGKIYSITKGAYDDFNDLYVPFEVYDNPWLAIRDEEGIVSHDTHIEVDNLSRIKDAVIKCFVEEYKIDFYNANKIFHKFFSDRSSILRFYVVEPTIDAIEPFYALAKLSCRLNVINHEQRNLLVNAIKMILRNNEQFYFDDIPNSGIVREGVRRFLNQFSMIFTTNYDQLLEICDRPVVHLHGSFLEKNIILGIDEDEKQRKNKYSERLDFLRNVECSEISIFGYSGRNDIHINKAIKENGGDIVFYCYDGLTGKSSPSAEDFKRDELHNKKYHECVKWCFGISVKDRYNFFFRNRNEVWDSILDK